MPAKKYRIVINEDTLPLITFLNDGVEPTNINKKKDPQFLFTIVSPREITVGRNAIQAEDDLYDENGTSKDKFSAYSPLIG